MRRPERPTRMFAVLVVTLAMLLPSSPVAAAPTADRAATPAGQRQDPSKLRAELSDVADAYEKSEARLGALSDRAAKLRAQVAATRKRLDRVRARVAQTAMVAYTNGGVDTTMLVLADDTGPTDVVDRMTTLSMLGSIDDAALRSATRERRTLGRQQARLAKTMARARAESAGLKAKRAKLEAALRKAARVAKERKERPVRATRARTSGRWACPVASPYTMMNTFGAPRPGGRSHEGTDIAAPRGTPIYAVEDGTISRAYSNTLGGIALILKGKSGDSYYYAHQEANVVRTGQEVKAGQLVARVGMTGDAQGTIYHLHFERWPNGGSAVDPWPFLLPLCGKKG